MTGWWSYWKVNLHPSIQSSAVSTRFSSRIVLDLAPSSFPSTVISFPVPAEEKHPLNMMPPQISTIGMIRECKTKMCTVKRVFHLSGGSLQLLQSHQGPLGCFSDQCSPCPAFQFRWASMSW
ncbi:hypothetical protein AMECASPLE_038205 [Ameca splendens]|uniref:Uncharacterized protein n=1 Tax=Ameca splendens TaxID=208324 RepID=A0ABV0XX68_9TELE